MAALLNWKSAKILTPNVNEAIGNNENRPELLEVINMKNREIIKALRIVLAHQAKLSEAWSKIHG